MVSHVPLSDLREQEIERYRSLFFKNPLPRLMFDAENLAILEANDAAVRQYGYSRQEFLSRTVRGLFSPEDLVAFNGSLPEPWPEADKTGPWRHLKHGGAQIFVEMTTQSHVHEGRPVRMASLVDVTARVEAEQALLSSEHRYREIFENANDIIYTHDLRGNFTSINKTAERLTGYSRSEAMRLNIAQLVAPEHLDLAQSMIRKKLGGERPTTYEIEILTKDGRRLPLEISTRLQFVNGKPAAIQGIARDITRRKLAQQKLEGYARELQAKNDELASALESARTATEAKSRFLANMSHEIRTPMNGIIGMSHLLVETGLNHEQQDYAETIRQSGETLLRIVNDILDFSKIESGRLTLQNAEFSLKDVVQEVLRLFEQPASSKGLNIELKTGPGFPAAVIGDRGRVQQILTNLLSNAIKFTASGNVSLEVRLVDQTETAYVFRFAVADTGIGIPTEALGRIFEAFVQADDSITRAHGGTGLGLAISQQLVQLMGGQIGVVSQIGKGSSFWFTVPLASVPR